MFQGLRTIVYPVVDMDKARQWYSQVVGKAPYFDEPFYIGFNVGGYELGLLPAEEPQEAGKPGAAVTYWGVPDADEAFARLMASGATEHEAVHDVGGGIRLGSAFDPFGNIVGVIYNPHFEIGAVDPK